LLTVLENHKIARPEKIKAAAELTNYAVVTRYPGPFEAVTEEEYRQALQIAETVFAWSKETINRDT